MQGKVEPIKLSNGKEYKSIKEACNSLGLNYRTVMARKSRGMDIDEQFNLDVLCNRCAVKLNKSNKFRDERLCKECGAVVKKERESKHKEKRRSTEKRWRERNTDKVLSYRAREKESGAHYMRTYGLSKSEKEDLFKNGCECCDSKEKLVVDHCHDSGKVRGCLCHGCNVSLGFAKDNHETLLALSKYAKRWKCKGKKSMKK